MRWVMVFVVGLGIGLGIGWVARGYFSNVPNVTGIVQAKKTPMEEKGEAADPIAAPTVDHRQLLALIAQQRVQAALHAFERMDIEAQENDPIYVAFHNNLYHLLSQHNWSQLAQWTTAMLQAGYNFSVLHVMDAKVALYQGNVLLALESLFTAQHYAEDDDTQVNTQTEIENTVIDVMNRYREGANTVSRPDALEMLQYVIEKQPDNPLFGLEISVLYADGGDYQAALDIINIIPYSERYQETLVALKTRYLDALSSLAQATVAIPLERVGQHFYVQAMVEQYPLTLLIDTGATTTALGRDTIASLYTQGVLVNQGESVSIGTANGVAEVNTFWTSHFAIGEFAVENFQLLEVELGDTGPFDGLLGMNFLSLFEFEIDQSNRQLFLTPK